MPLEIEDISILKNAAIVAPAGHGKTEIIATVSGVGKRALILTHTHAGVHAIRERLKRRGIPHACVAVDTIAGWSMRYAHAFPRVSQPSDGMPQSSQQWNQLYLGVTQALRVSAVREVVSASYDRIMIDEYQDCNGLQHDLAVALSSIVPTLIFGDPMQGIFEFAGASLSWESDIYPKFPFATNLETPHRWVQKNPLLGEWIAETREKLMHGESIDLADPRIHYHQCNNAFDMAAFFEGIDEKEGSFAAIHCNKQICYKLAKAASGGYQAIEELAAKRLRDFASVWDQAIDAKGGKLCAIKKLFSDCFKTASGNNVNDFNGIKHIMEVERNLDVYNEADAAHRLMMDIRKYADWKIYRAELWRDAERAVAEVAAGRAENMMQACDIIRQRISVSGRRLPKRTVSTPLLLKGLEFDHVVIPDASHFMRESQAQAKLFYVAISRATQSLTISAPERWLKLNTPIK